jgi:hypothetical protein
MKIPGAEFGNLVAEYNKGKQVAAYINMLINKSKLVPFT